MSTSAPTPLFSLLARLRADEIVSLTELEHIAAGAPTPWWLATLQALAAWLASLFMLAAFYVPVLMIGDSPTTRGLGGLLLAGVAIHLFRRDGVFVGQVALAFSLAAQALVVSALAGDFFDFDTDHRVIAAFGAVVALIMMIPRSTPTHRTTCALVAMVFGAVASFNPEQLAIQASVVCAGSAGLWLTRCRWAAKPYGVHLKAIANAASLLALPAAWLLPAFSGSGFVISPLFRSLANSPSGAWHWMFSLCVGMVTLATIFHLTRDLRLPTRVVALACALGLAFAAQFAPGLIFALSLFVAAFQACHRPWAGVALLCAVLYLSEFYYNLQVTLLVKAAALAACGLLLLVLRQWLLRQTRTDTPR